MLSEAQNLPGTGETSPDAAKAAEQVGNLAATADDGLIVRRIDPATASPEMASVLARVTTDFQGRLQKVSQNPGVVTIERDASTGVIAKEENNVGIRNTLSKQLASIFLEIVEEGEKKHPAKKDAIAEILRMYASIYCPCAENCCPSVLRTALDFFPLEHLHQGMVNPEERFPAPSKIEAWCMSLLSTKFDALTTQFVTQLPQHLRHSEAGTITRYEIISDIVHMEEDMVEMLSTLRFAPSVPEIKAQRNASIVGLAAAVVTDCPDPLRSIRDLQPLRKSLKTVQDSVKTEKNAFMRSCHTVEAELLGRYIKRLEYRLMRGKSDEETTSDASVHIPTVTNESGSVGISKQLLKAIFTSAVEGAETLRQQQRYDRGLRSELAKVDSAIAEKINRFIAKLPDPITSREQIAEIFLEILKVAVEKIFAHVYHGQENFSEKDNRIEAVYDYRTAIQVVFEKLQESFPVAVASWKDIATHVQPKIQLLSPEIRNDMQAYIFSNPQYQQEHRLVFTLDRSFQVLSQSLLPDDITPEMFDWYRSKLNQYRIGILEHCKKSRIPHLQAIRKTYESNAKALSETAMVFFPGNPLFTDSPRIAAADPQPPSERETSSPSITRDQLILLCEELVFSKTANEVSHIPKLWQMDKEKLPEIITVENYDCLQSLTACCYFALPRIQNSSCDSDIAQILNDNNALPSRKLSKEEMDALLDIEIGAKVFFSLIQETLRIPTVSLKDFTEALEQVFQSMLKQFFDKQSARFQNTSQDFNQLQSITDIGKAFIEAMPEKIDILQAKFLILQRVNSEQAVSNIVGRSAPGAISQYNKMIAALPKALDRVLEKFFPAHATTKKQAVTVEPEKEPMLSRGYDQLPDASIWTADTTFSNSLPENFEEGLYLIDNLNPTVLEAKIQEIFKTVKEDRAIGETLGIETKPLAIVIPLLSRFRRLAKTVVGEFDGPISTILQYQKIKAGFGFAIQSLTGPHAETLRTYISEHFLRPWFADIEARVSTAASSVDPHSDAQPHESESESLGIPISPEALVDSSNEETSHVSDQPSSDTESASQIEEPLAKPIDPLQEAMEAADIPRDKAALYVEKLMTTALEMAVTTMFSGKITTLNQAHIEDIHAEVMRFSTACTSIISEEVSRVIAPESAPSSAQLQEIALQTMIRMGESQTQENDFLTKEDHEAMLEKAFSTFLQPTIDAAELLVSDMGVSDRGPVVGDQTSAASVFPRLDSAVQQFTETRNRGVLRKAEQERQVRLLGLPDAVRYIEEQQVALSAMIKQLIENAQAGDLHAMETLQDSGDHIQLLRQLLALRIQSSH